MDSDTPDQTLLETEVAAHKVGSRTIQAALLAWFLEAVWKLDPEDVVDAICDGPGDKGIDAIYVDDDSAEITVFQSKWRNDPTKSTQGDNELKSFSAVSGYFDSPESFDALMASKPNDELRKLLARQEIRTKIESENYGVRLIFLTNAQLDSSGSGYVTVREHAEPPFKVYEGDMLADVAERTQRPALRSEMVTIEALEPPIVRKLTDTEQMAVTLVQAKELVKLPGIADQTLFSRNVRLAVGRTSVNSELRETVRTSSEHRLFPAFHNGLTLLTDELSVDDKTLQLTGIGVVNGCQSLTTLFNNSDAITDGLSLLVKVVQVPSSSNVSDRITYRSNNQNAVTLRDQRSTDRATLALQRDVQNELGSEFFFKVKTGEQPPKGVVVMENTSAAQLIMAFYLEEPWAAVRKLRLFDQDFRRIFSRTITPYHLYLLHLVDEAVEKARADLRADLKASFAAVRFTLIYLVGRVLAQSEAGAELIKNPRAWISDLNIREEVRTALETISFEVVNVANDFVELRLEEDPDFDPKVTFKSQSGVAGVRVAAIRDAKTQDRRGRSYYFAVSPIAS